MRLYSFVNMYLSGIHAGIQTAHVIHTMQRKYESKQHQMTLACKYNHHVFQKKRVLDEWLDDHKTIYVLNGGNQASLQSLYRELTKYSALLNLPIGRFHEGMTDLNGALTAVCIVVPTDIYATKWLCTYEPGIEPAYDLRQLLGSYRFAN